MCARMTEGSGQPVWVDNKAVIPNGLTSTLVLPFGVTRALGPTLRRGRAFCGRAIWTALQQYIVNPRYWLLTSIYVGSVAGGSVLVRLFIQPFAQKVTGKPGLLTAGAYIGMVERFLLTSLVASNQFGAVGFVLAAKSIARYKQ